MPPRPCRKYRKLPTTSPRPAQVYNKMSNQEVTLTEGEGIQNESESLSKNSEDLEVSNEVTQLVIYNSNSDGVELVGTNVNLYTGGAESDKLENSTEPQLNRDGSAVEENKFETKVGGDRSIIDECDVQVKNSDAIVEDSFKLKGEGADDTSLFSGNSFTKDKNLGVASADHYGLAGRGIEVEKENNIGNISEYRKWNDAGITEEKHMRSVSDNRNMVSVDTVEEKIMADVDENILQCEGIEEENMRAIKEENLALTIEGDVRGRTLETDGKLDCEGGDASKELHTTDEVLVEQGACEERGLMNEGGYDSIQSVPSPVKTRVEKDTTETKVKALLDIDRTASVREGGSGEEEREKLTSDGNNVEDSENNEENASNDEGGFGEEEAEEVTNKQKDNGNDEDSEDNGEGGSGELEAEKVTDGGNAVEEIEHDEESEDNTEGDYEEEGGQKATVCGDEVQETEDDKECEDNEEGASGEEEKVTDDGEGVGESEDDEEIEEDEEYAGPSECISDTMSDRRKQKNMDIYVSGLDKNSVEEDLVKVFGKFGEIVDARIARRPSTNQSKGFAFLRYATIEQTNYALSEIKDGIEVNGKFVKISASQDTLYMVNICKIWTKDHIFERLKAYGIENVDEIHLPDDPKIEGNNRGFALLEFHTHSDALEAFQRLRKPGTDFGSDESATVAFAETQGTPIEEFLLQLKTVYVEGLLKSLNEEKLKGICKQYGEIEAIKIFWKVGKKRKDFGYITYTTHESALACVEGINSGQIGEGTFKIKANIAKPHANFQHQRGKPGEFEIYKDSGQKPDIMVKGHGKSRKAVKESESTQHAGNNKPKGTKGKRKAVVEQRKSSQKLKRSRRGNLNRDQISYPEDHGTKISSKLGRNTRKRENLPPKVDNRGKREVEAGYIGRPSKKPRGTTKIKQNNVFNNPWDKPHFRKGHVRGVDSSSLRSAASTRNALGSARNQFSGSKTHRSDMEPHAGYIEPAAMNKNRHHAGYHGPSHSNRDRPHERHREPPHVPTYHPHERHRERPRDYRDHPYERYLEPALRSPGQRHVRYLEPAFENLGHSRARYMVPAFEIRRQPHARYLETSPTRQTLPRVEYIETAVEKEDHTAYDYQSRRRVDGYIGETRRLSTHDGGSAAARYAGPGYERDSPITVYHPTREVYSPRGGSYYYR